MNCEHFTTLSLPEPANGDGVTRDHHCGKCVPPGAPGDTAQRRSSATAIFAPSTYRAYERSVVPGLTSAAAWFRRRVNQHSTSRRKHPMFTISCGSRIAVIILSLGVVAGTTAVAQSAGERRQPRDRPLIKCCVSVERFSCRATLIGVRLSDSRARLTSPRLPLGRLRPSSTGYGEVEICALRANSG